MSSIVVQPMAKSKTKPKDPRDDWERKPLVLQVRGSPEWKAWLDRAAKFSRMSVSVFIDQAAARAAREAGFDEPPPER